MREVERAKVMLGYADGATVTELQRQFGFSRPMIYRCVDKALAAGIQMGLKDKYHRPHEPEISDAASGYTALLEYPVKTMNVLRSGPRFQRSPLRLPAPRPYLAAAIRAVLGTVRSTYKF